MLTKLIIYLLLLNNFFIKVNVVVCSHSNWISISNTILSHKENSTKNLNHYLKIIIDQTLKK